MKSFYQMIQLMETDSSDYYLKNLNITGLRKCLTKFFFEQFIRVYKNFQFGDLNEIEKKEIIDYATNLIELSYKAPIDQKDQTMYSYVTNVFYNNSNNKKLEQIGSDLIRLWDYIRFLDDHLIQEAVSSEYKDEVELQANFRTSLSEDEMLEIAKAYVIKDIISQADSFKVFGSEVGSCIISNTKNQDHSDVDWRPTETVPDDYYAL